MKKFTELNEQQRKLVLETKFKNLGNKIVDEALKNYGNSISTHLKIQAELAELRKKDKNFLTDLALAQAYDDVYLENADGTLVL